MEDLILRVSDWETYQHYKKKNKNFNEEQKWFMFHGRQLLRDMKFMQLSPVVRDFLVTGCWAVGSQNSGFLPEVDQHAFWIRRDINEVKAYRQQLLDDGWLEAWEKDAYEKFQSIIPDQQEKRSPLSYG